MQHDQETKSQARAERRPYVQPSLTELGDIVELTKGTTGTKFDVPANDLSEP